MVESSKGLLDQWNVSKLCSVLIHSSPIDVDIMMAPVTHEEGSHISRQDDMNVEPPPSQVNPKASPASTQVIHGQWSQTEEGPSFQAGMKHTRDQQSPTTSPELLSCQQGESRLFFEPGHVPFSPSPPPFLGSCGHTTGSPPCRHHYSQS